jgi:hypothetical protein
MSLGPPNGTYNIGTKLRALKEGESKDVQTAIDNIIDKEKTIMISSAQFQYGSPIYSELKTAYNNLKSMTNNPELIDYAAGKEDYYKKLENGYEVSPAGGRRRRHKHKTMKRRRSVTKRRHHRKTGRRNRH